MYDLVYYEDARGRIPFESNFLLPLHARALCDKRAMALLKHLQYRMIRLKRDGTRCGEDITKHIEGDIWELRVSTERAFFFVWRHNKIVILHAFTKGTQKTPKREIEKAKLERDDWVRRCGR